MIPRRESRPGGNRTANDLNNDNDTSAATSPASNSLSIAIATQPGPKAEKWQQRKISWTEFLGQLDDEPAGSKESAYGYVFGELRGEGLRRRKKDTVIERSALTLDVDHPAGDFLARLWAELGEHAAAAHTTYSATAEAPRYRVIVPLAVPLLPDDYRAAVGELMRRVSPDGGEFDAGSSQPERLMYFPAAAPGQAYWHEAREGTLLDAAPLAEAARAAYVAHMPAPPQGGTAGPSDARAYFRSAVSQEADNLAFRFEGSRNEGLHRAGFKLGQLAHMWPTDDAEDAQEIAREALREASEENGMLDDPDGDAEFSRTFANGWESGLLEPRDVKPVQQRDGSSSGSSTPPGGGVPSAASQIVDLALAKYTLGSSEKDGPFALPKQGAPVVKMLRGGKDSLRAELAKDYRRTTGRVAPQQALTDALQVLEGEAQDLEPVELHMRVAAAQGYHWYDLGDQTGRAVRIGADGWEVVERPPVLFQRSALTAASPEPERGGTVDDLRALTNAAAADQPLLIAAMVAAFWPSIAHPIVTFSGEQGTGKSTNAMRVTGIVDPSTVPLRKSPRDADSWVTAAAGSWVVTVDNISTISEWFSDALCRASTGDGDVKRQLYKDASLIVFSFRRCVMLTGIDLGGLRGDLTERLLRIELETIRAENRRSEAQMAEEYAAAHPRTIGALLDLVSQVMAVLPRIELAETMRLADFHRIMAAVDEVLGTDGCARYKAQHQSMAADSLTANPFTALMMAHVTTFAGTATELLELVQSNNLEHHRPPAGWPKSARAVTTLLKRDAPALRAGGWKVTSAENRNHVLTWTLQAPLSAG